MTQRHPPAIIQHEHWQGTDLRAFLAKFWAEYLRGFPVSGPVPMDLWPPEFSENKGTIKATVNQGRWIVECPNDDCSGALCVSATEPYYICVYCGSEENDSQWYKVVYPRNKVAIERELLKRPAKRDFHAKTRNWVPGEGLATLKKQREVLERAGL